MAFEVGRDVGGYHIERRIGAGGMASVYQAYQSRLDRRVAIKVMHPNIAQQGDFLARFEREARIVAKLDHPNIVPIYDFNEDDGEPYLVMKYVDGLTLKGVRENSALTHERILELMQPIANALDYAHEQGILHRDIKPSNIIVDERGISYLMDFGLARIAQAGESTMSADVMLGTPHYISPEQAQGNRDLDARTDVYSLGIVLYELVAGVVPFSGDTSYAIIHDQIYTPAPPVRQFNSDLPEAVEIVLRKALEKNRDERYQTPGALMRDFTNALQGATATVPPRFAESNQAPASPKKPPLPPEPPRILGRDKGKRGRNRRRGGIHGARQEVRDSMREARDEVRSSMQEAWQEVRDSMREAGQDIRDSMRDVNRSVKGAEYDDDDYYDDDYDNLSEDEKLRRDIEKRIEQRNEFYTHFAIYAAVNVMLWVIFLASGSTHPWPIYATFGWGIAIVIQYVEYHNNYGAGRLNREQIIEEEMERERRRREGRYSGKLKNEDKSKRGDIRLTEDGELTDSFADGYYEDEDDAYYQGGR